MPSTSTPAKPAAKTPAKAKTIGVKEIAEHLDVEPRVLRAFLRRSKRAVGRGTRYEWKSLTDPEAKKVIAEWKAAQEKKSETPAES
jgi:transposase